MYKHFVTLVYGRAGILFACLLVSTGIFFLPLGVWIRAYLAMGVVMIIQTTISLARTLRDIEETDKPVVLHRSNGRLNQLT